MKTTIKVVRQLFLDLKYANVDQWSESRLLGKFRKIRHITDGSEPIKTREAEDLFAAIHNDHEIELAGNDKETNNITPEKG
jgi:predicted transcriptional regulator